METMDFNSYLYNRYRDAKQREEQRLREAKHRRNVAAVIDFASSLISLVGKKRGARYPVATNNLPRYQELYDNVRERYSGMMQDYRAAIADNHLRQRLSSGGSGASTLAVRNVGFIPTTQGNGGLRLSSGSLENSIRNYYSSNN